MTNYGMFTEEGNKIIDTLVSLAKDANFSWQDTLVSLLCIAHNKKYEEAMDTAVREAVFCTLDFDK